MLLQPSQLIGACHQQSADSIQPMVNLSSSSLLPPLLLWKCLFSVFTLGSTPAPTGEHCWCCFSKVANSSQSQFLKILKSFCFCFCFFNLHIFFFCGSTSRSRRVYQGGVKPSASIRENKSHAGFSPGVFIPLKTGTHPKFNQVGFLPSCTQTSAQMWRARPPAVVCRQDYISADHSLFPALRFWIAFFFSLSAFEHHLSHQS